MWKVTKKIAYLCIYLMCLVLCACSGESAEVVWIGSEDEQSISEVEDVRLPKYPPGAETDSDEIIREEEAFCEKMVRIYVCGAVNRPGVVEIPAGSRVEDALEAAGGFAESADVACVNLADWVTDGQMLYFPTEEEVKSGQSGQVQTTGMQASVAGVKDLVNINTADVELLCTLPGIGESRAAAILAYRKEQGLFRNCEDIMSVPGIKAGLYEKIRDRITVD